MIGTIPRRRFLQVAAAGAGGAVWGLQRPARAAEGEQPVEFALGLQSYSLRSFPVEKAIEIAQSLGIATVEFFPGHLKMQGPESAVKAVLDACSEARIKPLGYGVSQFTKNHAANRKLFEFAKECGIRNLTADPHEDAFDSLDELVAEFDIRIAIHNHGPGARYDKIADVLNAIKGRHPSIGACADLGHYIRSGEDPAKAITLFEGRLFGVHLKDFDASKKDAKGVILGQGQLDLGAAFRALKKVNFPADACLAIEYEEHPKDPVDDLRACVAATKEAIAQVSG